MESTTSRKIVLGNRMNVSNSRFVLLTMMGLSLSGWSSGEPSPPTKRDPITLRMKIKAPFSQKSGWELTVKASGTAHLTLDNFPRSSSIFQVSVAQREQLRKTVVAEQFFTLGAEYGDRVPDGDTRTLTITQGQQSKSVILLFLRSTSPKQSEIKRALRIWKLGESWIEQPQAKKMQPYDQRILDVPAKPSR